MNRYTVAEIDTVRGETKDPWLEFQRSADLSTGLYVLQAGEVDEQVPHTEDEIYVAVSGKARFETASGTVDVEPGTVLFVPANEEHRFVDVTETLQLVVVFGPAEGSRDG
ncbi:MAG TPA: cupin domain-containing protein [Actinomycetes bacterium]|nr:cupin domain-containing protein [Actinomycetes bacterium]